MRGIPVWGGLDAGADHSRLCLIDDQLQPVLDLTVPSDVGAMLSALEEYGPEGVQSIVVETTAVGTHLVRGLRAAGYTVTIYQAGQVSRYLRIRRNKTDNNDARGLAELARLGLPSLGKVHLKSPEIQRMRTKLQFRHRLTFQRVACEGMIRSLIRLHGGRLKSSQSAHAIVRNVTEELDRLITARIDLAPDVRPLLGLAVEMRRYLEAVDKEIAQWVADNPVCASFLDIPGVGPLCAASFYTAVENPDRFARASDVGPYLGLTPKVSQSGESLRHGRISKMGSKLTRTHLVNSASIIFAGRIKDHPLKAWGLRVAERAGVAKARVAVARRMAVTMLAMWKSDRRYDADLSRPREVV